MHHCFMGYLVFGDFLQFHFQLFEPCVSPKISRQVCPLTSDVIILYQNSKLEKAHFLSLSLFTPYLYVIEDSNNFLLSNVPFCFNEIDLLPSKKLIWIRRRRPKLESQWKRRQSMAYIKHLLLFKFRS